MKKIQEFRYAAFILIYAAIYMLLFALLEMRENVTYHIIHNPIDDIIPFCEYFIVPYYFWFIYIFSVTCYFVLFYRKPDECRRLLITLCSGMTIFLLVSYFYPNGLELRPEQFERDNLFTKWVSLLYQTDTATNVLPSIHVYNTLCLYVAVVKSQKFKNHRWFCFVNLIICVSIILSTVFLKQHSVIDVLGAMFLYLAVYLLVYKKQEMKQYQRVRNFN